MFTAETLSFLRALERHNDREWFKAHRDRYESQVRNPAIAFVERMAGALPAFAPEALASPRASLFRIHRDTRFSPDKSPFKTNVGMIFPWRGLARHEGAGFYVEVATSRALVAGGLYAPQPAPLRAVRQHIAADPERFRAIVEARSFKTAFNQLEGERLTRVPAGFARDHPAGEYLMFRQFLAWREYPADVALSPRFFAEVVRRFRQMAPLIRFLNKPIVKASGGAFDLASPPGTLAGPALAARRTASGRPKRKR